MRGPCTRARRPALQLQPAPKQSVSRSASFNQGSEQLPSQAFRSSRRRLPELENGLGQFVRAFLREKVTATFARSASPTPSDPPSAKTGIVNRLAARAFACARPSASKFARYQAKPARIAPGAEYCRVYSSRAAGSIAYDRKLFVAKIKAR